MELGVGDSILIKVRGVALELPSRSGVLCPAGTMACVLNNAAMILRDGGSAMAVVAGLVAIRSLPLIFFPCPGACPVHRPQGEQHQG